MGQIATILQSLVPRNEEELSLLQRLLHQAQLMARGIPLYENDPGLFDAIPHDARRYFHGLVEAVEIYQSIRGQSPPVQNLTLQDPVVYELKQIRDMCLEDSFRSIY